MVTPAISNINPIHPSPSAIYESGLPHPAITFQGERYLRPNRNHGAYLALDLTTPKLNSIHQHLWLAGLPTAARPLHRQKRIGRCILVTEDPDEHLVWFEGQIFIKPLPGFLLNWNYWNDNLCSSQDLRKSACGLLLSYAWLVRYESDLEIAKEIGLLPRNIEWPNWVKFLEVFLDNINLVTLSDVNRRYKYGELRLSRLNSIYRFIPPAYSLKSLIRGYRSGSTWYNAFFGRHFKWMLAVFAVLSVLLSALQVGLSTSTLQNNGPFQKASYGFTIASLAAVVASVVVVFCVWLGLFWYHLLSTWRNDRAVDHRRHAGESP